MPGRCGRCGKNVFSAEERLGLGKSWHVRCFTCAICSRSLDSWSLAENRELNEIFCKTCYRVNFATQGYGYGANEPTLLALPQGIRSSSSSSLIVAGSKTTNYNKFNGDSTDFKNSHASQTTTKQVQDKYATETLAVTKTTKHKGHRHQTHHNSQDHNDINNNINKNQIICQTIENDRVNVHRQYQNPDHDHHRHYRHRHKHKQKQDCPSPVSSHSSASNTSTILAQRAPTVHELKANYRTQVETQEFINMRNDTETSNGNKTENPSSISRSENPGSKRCSGRRAGNCHIPAPRYPPKHPQIHRIPLNPPNSFGQASIRSKTEEQKNWRTEKNFRNEINENENQENNLRISEIDKTSSFGRSKVKVKVKGKHQGQSTSKNFGGGEPCKRCGRPVYWAEMRLGTAGVYHTECFSCCCCGKNVESTTVSENQGEIFCTGCYRRFFGVHGIGFNNTLQTP